MNIFYKGIFWLLLSFFWQATFGQTNEMDSLKRVLAVEKNNDKISELLKALVNLGSGIDLKIGLDFARLGVAHAEKIKDKAAQPEFYEMQGRMHANLLELDSASFYFDKAIAP